MQARAPSAASPLAVRGCRALAGVQAKPFEVTAASPALVQRCGTEPWAEPCPARSHPIPVQWQPHGHQGAVALGTLRHWAL